MAEIEDQTKELITLIAGLLEDNKHLSAAVLPAITAIITSLVEVHVDNTEEDKERYIYCMRGYGTGGKNTIVSVDFDIMPLLGHLEESGIAEFGVCDIIPLMKYPEDAIEEDVTKLH